MDHTLSRRAAALAEPSGMSNWKSVVVLACGCGSLAPRPCAALPDESALTIYSSQRIHCRPEL